MAAGAAPARALVTGGNGNLGLAVARLLADGGAEVHVTVRDDRARLALAADARAAGLTAHVCDVSDDASVRALYAAVGGPLAAVVATVGGFRAGPFAELPAEAIDAEFALNLRSTILTLRHAHAALAANPGGAAAVVIANRPALSAGPGVALTTAMKAGVVSLARSLAAEWKDDGIAVNAVAPGIMDTPENRRAMPDADPSRWPTPAAVAEIIAFLCSPQGRLVSGAVLPAFGRS